MKKLLLSVGILLSLNAVAQNVGINATGAAPVSSAALDVDMANKGILVPRVALTTTAAFAPVTGTATTSLLVYNTASASSGSTAVSPGYYYWDGAKWVRMMSSGNDWLVGTSATTVNYPGATGSFGTSDNNHVDLVTNATVRGRLSNLGEFFIGTTSTSLVGDLMNGVSNATFPWAINGYSSFNGSAVYGGVLAGTTQFGAVQGEYYGTAGFNTAGVRGINANTSAGTGFRTLAATGPRAGVMGTVSSTTGSYTFGVHASFSSTSIRCGAVYGDDFGIAAGGLGYYASTGVDYAVYGFGQAHQNGTAAGKGTKSLSGLDEPNTMIGLGIYGGMMGGWMRGLVYGTHIKGERYSLYVDGKTYANAPVTQLVETEGPSRQPVYSSSAMKVEISARGKANLSNGEMYVAFTNEFKSTISTNPDELTITVSPMGNSNGLYIVSYDSNGFTVKENNSGTTNVQFNWIAIGTRMNYETMEHSPEILSNDFDQKMNGVMYNDNDTESTPQTMWWDGTEMRFDVPPPAKVVDPNYTPVIRPKTTPASINTQGGSVE